MNHKAICQHEGERLYRLRAYMSHQLDNSVFEGLLNGGHDLGMQGYCLDALDEHPAGSMHADTSRYRPTPYQGHTVRGLTLADLQAREALASELVAQILAEEKAQHDSPQHSRQV